MTVMLVLLMCGSLVNFSGMTPEKSLMKIHLLSKSYYGWGRDSPVPPAHGFDNKKLIFFRKENS
jgi:hypothetical protein